MPSMLRGTFQHRKAIAVSDTRQARLPPMYCSSVGGGPPPAPPPRCLCGEASVWKLVSLATPYEATAGSCGLVPKRHVLIPTSS